MEQLPKRKPNRLPNYDYSLNSAYFITFCVQNHGYLLWDSPNVSPPSPNRFLSTSDVGANSVRPPGVLPLSNFGKVVEQAILGIEAHYPMVSLVKYAVMPNHVHLLLVLQGGDGRTMFAPTVSRIVKHTKEYVTKCIGKSI